MSTPALEVPRPGPLAGLEALAALPDLRVLRLGRHVDLLVTDVGLPGGMNGRQVADAARERLPGLPALFITGYAGSVLQEQLAPGMDVIGKPFSLQALSARMRAMLDAAPTQHRNRPERMGKLQEVAAFRSEAAATPAASDARYGPVNALAVEPIRSACREPNVRLMPLPREGLSIPPAN